MSTPGSAGSGPQALPSLSSPCSPCMCSCWTWHTPLQSHPASSPPCRHFHPGLCLKNQTHVSAQFSSLMLQLPTPIFCLPSPRTLPQEHCVLGDHDSEQLWPIFLLISTAQPRPTLVFKLCVSLCLCVYERRCQKTVGSWEPISGIP